MYQHDPYITGTEEERCPAKLSDLCMYDKIEFIPCLITHYLDLLAESHIYHYYSHVQMHKGQQDLPRNILFKEISKFTQ